MTDALLAFLRARYAEEEQAAQDVLSLESDEFTWEYHWARHGRYRGRVTRQSFEPGAPTPRQVLAEVEAKRRILDGYETDGVNPPWKAWDDDAWVAIAWTIRVLALPYADHADYRVEWRP